MQIDLRAFMVVPRLNVTFDASGAHSLRGALAMAGRDEEVLFLPDDLSLGPINPGNPTQRVQWWSAEVGVDDARAREDAIREFWARVTTAQAELVVWMSRNYITEYCGFLELLRRVERAPVSVVDVAGVQFTRNGRPAPETSMAFAYVPARDIVEQALFERTKQVSDIECTQYKVEWRRIRDENGAIRVPSGGYIVSAPITHYDDLIRSCLSSEWQKCSVVVATALERVAQGECRNVAFFIARLVRLFDDGEIDCDTDGQWDLHTSMVRQRPR